MKILWLLLLAGMCTELSARSRKKIPFPTGVVKTPKNVNAQAKKTDVEPTS